MTFENPQNQSLGFFKAKENQKGFSAHYRRSDKNPGKVLLQSRRISGKCPKGSMGIHNEKYKTSLVHLV